jgi:hypothetical protein
MIRQIRNAILYIVASGLIWLVKTTLQLPKTSFGCFSFYGPKKMGEEFALAIRTELPRYDAVMATELIERKDMLTFIRLHDIDRYLPDMGTFFVPQWVSDQGLESISQYIAFCYLGAKETGIGLKAAVKVSDRDKVLSRCKQAMANWIRQKNFPKRWLVPYEK